MELLTRVVVFAVILIAVLLAAYFIVVSLVPSGGVTEQQALNQVRIYELSKYPYANITSTNATALSTPGNWKIVIGIVLNFTSPCPSYFSDTFDYPQYFPVDRNQTIYTRPNCTIVGVSSSSVPYSLYNPSVAVTRAYTFNIPEVNAFIRTYGFDNVSVSSHFYNGAVNLNGLNFSNIYLVKYSAPSASNKVYVVLSQMDGSLLGTYNVTG